jgi:hypothetical protein
MHGPSLGRMYGPYVWLPTRVRFPITGIGVLCMDPMYGCQLGTRCPIPHVKEDQMHLVGFSDASRRQSECHGGAR